jgi:hypothetical protein
MIANLSKEDRQGEVRINAQRLAVPLENITSWPDKKAVAMTDGRIRLEVPRLGYRMVFVGKP